MSINQILAIIFLLLLIMVLLGKWTIWPVCIAIAIFVLVLIIRAVADLYWSFRGEE